MRDHGCTTIAATAHYATKGLDAGQIVAQESRSIEALGPTPSTRELSVEGRQVEVTALMTALKWHALGEVFLLGDRALHFPA